jgi:hypothetical protein
MEHIQNNMPLNREYEMAFSMFTLMDCHSVHTHCVPTEYSDPACKHGMKKIFCYVHNLAVLAGSQFKEVEKKSIFRDITRCNQLKVEPTFQRNMSPISSGSEE